MQKQNSILILQGSPCCYDSTAYFGKRIAAAFEKLSWEVETASCPKGDESTVLQQYYGKEYTLILDINSNLPGKKDGKGRYCLDQIQGQKWHYILDHPLYHHEILSCPLQSFCVICLDENHASYIRAHYPHIDKVLCLPLAADQAETLVPYSERKTDVLFTGTYTEPEVLLYQMVKYPPKEAKIMESLVQTLLDHPEMTQEEAALAFAEEKQVPCFLREHYLADMFLRASLREELLAQLVRAGITVTVYGHHWEAFVKKCKEKKIPEAEKYLRLAGEVPYGQLPAIYADAKIALNQLPWFKAGMHDRIPLALMNGSVCVTDGNRYIEECFQADEELYLYSLEDMREASGLVRELLEHPDQAARTAARGYAHAVGVLCWDAWVQSLLQAVFERKMD